MYQRKNNYEQQFELVLYCWINHFLAKIMYSAGRYLPYLHETISIDYWNYNFSLSFQGLHDTRVLDECSLMLFKSYSCLKSAYMLVGIFLYMLW